MRTYTYTQKAEELPLLDFRDPQTGLSLFFATLCIVDIFGVFPIIALPGTIVQCGILGIPLVLVVFLLQIHTASLLGKSWNIAKTLDPNISRKNRYPLAAVTELTLGRRASSFVSCLLDLTIFAGGIPNLLVASQNLQLFGLKISDMQFNVSSCYWLLVVGVLICPVMWLGSPRDMKCIVSTSAITIALTTVLIWWSIWTDVDNTAYSPVPTSPSWDLFISGYGVLAFQFDVHPTLLTVQVDMKKPKNISKAVVLGFIISGSIFAVTAGLAVWRYGGSTSANVLQVMPQGIFVQAAVLISALQLCLTSAIGHSALFQHLEEKLQVKQSFSWRRCLVRSSVVALGIALGESVPRFDIVMSLIGGTLTGPLVFILPPLMYSKARAMRITTLRRASAPAYLGESCVMKPDRRAIQSTFNGPERNNYQAINMFSDPRAHSKSTHCSFKGGLEDADNGYSFVYYDSDDLTEPNAYTGCPMDLDEFEDRQLCGRDDALELSRTGSLPIMVDATRPSIRRPRRQELVPQVYRKKPKKFVTPQKVIDWFGYLIVVIGICITVSSTYINVKNTVNFVKFDPPCIFNATVFIPGLQI